MAFSSPRELLTPFYKRFIMPLLSEPTQYKLRYLSKHGYWPNLKKPRSLMEKVAWLLRYDRNPLRAEVADRVKVRKIVAKYAPECKFPAHLWVGTAFTAEVWNALPTKFVLKGNHGSGMVLLVNKKKHSFKEVESTMHHWLDVDYSTIHQEWVYAHAQRLLIAEEMLELASEAPPDWKFLCGNGKVLLVQLDLGRFSHHTRNLYNREFVRFRHAKIDYPQGVDIDKPRGFDKAVVAAEKLAALFDFIRVDLYIVGDDIYFGELTNYPGAVMDALEPRSFDFEIGSQIQLAGIHNQPH